MEFKYITQNKKYKAHATLSFGGSIHECFGYDVDLYRIEDEHDEYVERVTVASDDRVLPRLYPNRGANLPNLSTMVFAAEVGEKMGEEYKKLDLDNLSPNALEKEMLVIQNKIIEEMKLEVVEC